MVALKRRPSGRCTDSTLITSAPIELSHAVDHGPDQNAVKSITRNPANGRSPTATDDFVSVVGAGTPTTDTKSEPAGVGGRRGRSGTAEKRNGARGRIHDSPGW